MMITSKKSAVLPTEAIREYQDLYQQRYGIELSFDEAVQLGEDLLQVVSLCSELTNKGGLHHE